MIDVKRILGILFAMLLSCALAAPAFAQATRTWVSGVGDDANPCSRTAPCKTFAGAISKTAAGGEISVLDPGGFGAVTITKSITLNGNGTLASILAAGTNGITISALATDTVVLRYLDINGGTSVSPGLKGIRFLNGKQLIIENSIIQNFSQAGIEIAPTATTGSADLVVSNTTITNNNGPAILSTPTGTLQVFATLDNARLTNNTRGIEANDGSSFAVKNSALSNNYAYGVVATGNARKTTVNLDKSMIASNDVGGLRAVGAQGVVRVSDSTVTLNGVGMEMVTGGVVATYGNNALRGNVASSAVPVVIPLE